MESFQSFNTNSSNEDYSSGIGLSIYKKPCFDDLLSSKKKNANAEKNPMFPKGCWSSSESSFSFVQTHSDKNEKSVGLFDSPVVTDIINSKRNVAVLKKVKISKTNLEKPKTKKKACARKKKKKKEIDFMTQFQNVIPDFSEFDNYELIIERGPPKRKKISNEDSLFQESFISDKNSCISHLLNYGEIVQQSPCNLRNKSNNTLELTNCSFENVLNESVDIFNSNGSDGTESKAPSTKTDNLSTSNCDCNPSDVSVSKKLPAIQTSTPHCKAISPSETPVIDNVTVRNRRKFTKNDCNSRIFLVKNPSLTIGVPSQHSKEDEIPVVFGQPILSAKKLIKQEIISENLNCTESRDIFESTNTSVEIIDNTPLDNLARNSKSNSELEKENFQFAIPACTTNILTPKTPQWKVDRDKQTHEQNFTFSGTALNECLISAMQCEIITKTNTRKSLRGRVFLPNRKTTRDPLINIRNTSTPLSRFTKASEMDSYLPMPGSSMEKLLESITRPCKVVLKSLSPSEILGSKGNSVDETATVSTNVHLTPCRITLNQPTYLENSFLCNKTAESLDSIWASFSQVYELSPKEKIMMLCDQDEVKELKTLLSRRELMTAEKIGEGSYAEVYKITCHDNFAVLKIVPIEGVSPNGETQMTYIDVLSELIISKEINSLAVNPVNQAPIFIEVKSVSLVEGKFPKKLLTEWKKFDKERNSENDYPGDYTDDQLFVVFQYSYGGQDLEHFTFSKGEQILSLLKQIAYGIAVSERALRFEHRDLHEGNVLVSKSNEKYIDFVIEGETLKCPCDGFVAKIIDFTLSRLDKDGVPIYKDLSEQGIFSGQGDSQYNVYRSMRNSTKSNWQGFHPITNVLWLKFLMTRLSTRHKKLFKKGSVAFKTLNNWINSIKKCSSTFEFVKKQF